MRLAGTREQLRDGLKAHLDGHHAAVRARFWSDLLAYPAFLIALIGTFVTPWMIVLDVLLAWLIWKCLVSQKVMAQIIDVYKFSIMSACLELENRELEDAGHWQLDLDGQPGVPTVPPGGRAGRHTYQHVWGRLTAPLSDGGQLQLELERRGLVTFCRSKGNWLSEGGVGSDHLMARFDDERHEFDPAPRLLGPGELLVRLLRGLFLFGWNFRPELRFAPGELLYHLSSSLPGSSLPRPFRLPRNPWVKVLVTGGLLAMPVWMVVTGRIGMLWSLGIKQIQPPADMGERHETMPFGFQVRPGQFQLLGFRDNGAGNWWADVKDGSLTIDGYSTQNVSYFHKNVERFWNGGDNFETLTWNGFPARRTPGLLWLRTPQQCLRISYFHRDSAQLARFWEQLYVGREFKDNYAGMQIQWPL